MRKTNMLKPLNSICVVALLLYAGAEAKLPSSANLSVTTTGSYGGTTTISSESVSIEFYNTLNGRTFETRSIKGRALPNETSSGHDLTISDSSIKKVINAVLKGEEPEETDETEKPVRERPDVPEWVPAIVSFVIFPGVIFLIVFLVKRAKRRKNGYGR